MNALALDAKRFVRLALLAIVLYILIIMISLMTMVKPVHAAGYVPASLPPANQAITCFSKFHPYNVFGKNIYGYINYSPTVSNVGSTIADCIKGLDAKKILEKAPVSWTDSYGTRYDNPTYANPTISYDVHAAYPPYAYVGHWIAYITDGYGYSATPRICQINSTAFSSSACACNAGYQPDLTTQTICVPVEVLTITLQADATIEPWNKKHDPNHLKANAPFTATVTNANGPLPPNVQVTITSEATQYGGGHHHHNSRPKGKLVATPAGTATPVSTVGGTNTITGNVDSNGVFSFTFGAEEASGDHKLTATCMGCKAPATSTVNVLIPDLVQLGADPINFELRGDKPWHPDNHYFSRAALLNIVDLASAYKKNFNSLLKINDGSLEKGGVLDLGQDWTYEYNGHAGHRKGVVVDTNNYSAQNPDFKIFAKKWHIDAQWHAKGTAPHYHLLLLGKDQ